MPTIRNGLPFGLLFEEPAPAPRRSVIPQYDERADLSFAQDQDGHWVPYVELRLSGTDIETRAQGEPTEGDQASCIESRSTWRPLASTDTFTKVAKEETDSD